MALWAPHGSRFPPTCHWPAPLVHRPHCSVLPELPGLRGVEQERLSVRVPVLGGEEQRGRERDSSVSMWGGAWEGDCDGGGRARHPVYKD